MFHTGEGGAIFVKDLSLFKKCFYSHNFGHDGPLDFHGLGINGKISELQAAMGLSVLPYMDEIIKSRKASVDFYHDNLNFTKVESFKLRENTIWNYSYYPIIFETESMLLKIQKKLNDIDIFPRRYFYPSLNKLKYVRNSEQFFSDNISSKILCLPLFEGMKESDLQKIVEIVNS